MLCPGMVVCRFGFVLLFSPVLRRVKSIRDRTCQPLSQEPRDRLMFVNDVKLRLVLLQYRD